MLTLSDKSIPHPMVGITFSLLPCSLIMILIDIVGVIKEETVLHILIRTATMYESQNMETILEKIRQSLIHGGDPNFPLKTINAATGDTSQTCFDIALSSNV